MRPRRAHAIFTLAVTTSPIHLPASASIPAAAGACRHGHLQPAAQALLVRAPRARVVSQVLRSQA